MAPNVQLDFPPFYSGQVTPAKERIIVILDWTPVCFPNKGTGIDHE